MKKTLKIINVGIILSISLGSISGSAKQTAHHYDGNEDAAFLDYQHLNCGNKAILGFRLIRPTPNTIAYEYTCEK